MVIGNGSVTIRLSIGRETLISYALVWISVELSAMVGISVCLGTDIRDKDVAPKISRKSDWIF